MEPIIVYVKRKLREVGPAAWDEIHAETGVAVSLMRKIAYGDRNNPGVANIQPLVTFFDEVEIGARKAPTAQAA